MLVALLVIIVFIITLASCVSDVRSLRIPNSHSLVILVSFIVAYALSPESFGAWWEHLGAGAGMFVITYLMFVAGMLGGGDSKLGTVLALWVGLKGLMLYVFYMAVVGGFVGIASLVIKKKKPFKNPLPGSWVAQVQEGRNAVPYGIAIVAGAWLALFHTGFLYHQMDELIKIIH